MSYLDLQPHEEQFPAHSRRLDELPSWDDGLPRFYVPDTAAEQQSQGETVQVEKLVCGGLARAIAL